MQLRVIAGVMLYLVAIAAPVSWLYVKYGPSRPVDAGSADDMEDDMVALAGTTAVAFMLGLCASKVNHPASQSLFEGFAEIVRGLRSATEDREPGGGRCANGRDGIRSWVETR